MQPTQTFYNILFGYSTVALNKNPFKNLSFVSMNLVKAKKSEAVFSVIENTLRKSPFDFYSKGFLKRVTTAFLLFVF